MARSAISFAQEKIRQQRTGDDQYYKNRPYVFVLRGPSKVPPLGHTGAAVFPLPVNPESFTYDLPFASQVTPLQEGGAVAEENGIVIGEIRLTATTGFKIRPSLDTSFGPSDGEFTGSYGDNGNNGGLSGGGSIGIGSFGQGISAQLAFWRLANRCFDGYSSLKKDPQYSKQTSMEFHVMKDDLHLTVIPKSFTLDRNADKERVTYKFSTVLAVVGPATANFFLPSPDINLLKKLKEVISTIRSTVQAITATINEITAAVDEISRIVSSVVTIAEEVTRITGAFDDLVERGRTFLAISKESILGTLFTVETASASLATADVSQDLTQAMRVIEDGLTSLVVAGTNYFKPGWKGISESYNKNTRGTLRGENNLLDLKRKELQDIAADAQGRMSIDQAFNGAIKPGDYARSGQAVDQARLNKNEYQGFEEREVTSGDSLQSLAAKYLKDANRWLELAIINQLKAPYITSGAKLPGTLQVGSKFMIPISKPIDTTNVFTTGATDTGASQIEKFLGQDFELVSIGNGQYGLAVDVAGGATDVRQIAGFPNLEQGIGSRLRTNQGENILYPNLGLPRTIGSAIRSLDLNDNKYQIRAQLLAEPRIHKIMSLQLDIEKDVLTVEADVQPVGFETSRTISRTLT